MADLTVAEVKQFSANLYQLAQQKGSRLRDKVAKEDMTAEKKFFERIGPTTARRKTGKFEDSPIIETPFTRRMLIPHDYDWGDMIETMEKLKTLTDPASGIVRAGSYALGRSIDDEIIAAATGTVYGGKEGTDAVVLPDSQKVAITVGGGGGNVGLNVGKLLAAKSIFGKNEVDLDDPENQLFMAVSQEQLDDLLAIEQVTSADYNTVKALAEGKIDTFMGFKFVRTERLTKVTTNRTCFAWAKSGIALALPLDIRTEVTKRADKCFNWYAYAALSVAAARVEETKVVQVNCEEDAA